MPSLLGRTLGLWRLACVVLLSQAGDAVGGVGTPVPHCLLVDQAAAAGSVTYTPMRRPGGPSPAGAAQPNPPLSRSPASPARVAPSLVAPTYYTPAPVPPAPIAPTHAAPAPVPPARTSPAAPIPLTRVAAPASVAPIHATPMPALTWAPSVPYVPAPLPVAPISGVPAIRGANAESAGTAAAKSIRPAKPGHRFLGVVSDVGMPDGLNLGLVVAPADWMRLVAAVGSNSASLDYRGGLSLVPMGWGPSFTVEVGHCNTAPTTGAIRTFFTVPSWVSPYVQQLGYTYVNAHVGFDYRVGGFTLFVHGGFTYLSGTLRSPDSVVVDSKTNTSIKMAQDGSVTAYTLSGKAGLLYMFGGL